MIYVNALNRMDLNNTILLFKQVVIQIATPYSTGTGFYLKDHDLIVTNEHVIRDNKSIVVANAHFKKQIVDVLYVDPKYDLAFLAAPKDHTMAQVEIENVKLLNQGDLVVAVGHPFGLKYTATQGIVSNLLEQQNDVNYIQHDAALNPGNSGGPLINSEGKIVGVNTFIIRDGNSIGFSLPIHYLISSIQGFKEGGGKLSVRCTACDNQVFETEEKLLFCPHCGAKMSMISDIESYEPVGINKTIEDMLMALNFDIDLSRRGPNNWEIIQGSAKINISYYAKTGLIIGDAYLCSLPKDNIQDIYTFLLQRNYDLESLTFSVRGKDIVISLLIYDQYLNVETAKELMMHLFEQADYFDDVLINKYGAEKQSSHKISDEAKL